MKKIALTALITACILMTATIGIAQTETAQTGQLGQMMKDRCPMDKGSMSGRGMCGMMGKTMVPTDDGGVVVMIGNKLFKYDKNLELKKETELPFDDDHMKKMMMRMHGKDMMGGTPDSPKDEESGE